MSEYVWQKSSYSGTAANCLYVAPGTAAGTIRLRESDAPDLILTAPPAALDTLIRAIKDDRLAPRAER
ncbi:DUF397 domain-containing protein [Streptosporangium nondiastaticum]|uniref:DUF397 domain-containing protein n=1 Tax=Streptosporangium nondiastaticum TaxID=35764 RepID=A0A9X7JKJ4_9ACTN|nr:DUF397 domain-containing protein [Streptosporangium nondiastaticum]PSJ25124.1 DUF397 domain-containing protein [Streptosporangium nondiastaticum]